MTVTVSPAFTMLKLPTDAIQDPRVRAFDEPIPFPVRLFIDRIHPDINMGIGPLEFGDSRKLDLKLRLVRGKRMMRAHRHSTDKP